MMPPLAVTGTAAAALAAVAFTLALPHVTDSPASVGAGVQPGPVLVTMAPGTTRAVLVKVRDTGSAAETLTILGGQRHGGQILPFPWVRRTSVTTAPGVWRTVTFTIAVPASTAPGEYREYVGAYGSAGSPTGPGGASFGAAAFTDLVITVTPSTAPRRDTRGNAHTTSTATGA